jgi:hypothetical protein
VNPSRRSRLLKAPTLLAAFALVFGTFAIPAAAASADASNLRSIVQQRFEAAGAATGLGAISGPTITSNQVTVPQINVQVIAGDQATRDNSTQTADNTLDLNQTAAAVTGDASADETSTATTGPATASNIVVGLQLNVQVIAGIGCDVDQVASNTLSLDQTAAAASGDANAVNGGNASSGAASAQNMARVSQRNLQVYICRGGSTGQQVAENVGDFEQTTAAATGSADADGGTAGTGQANATSDLRVGQANRQIVID